MSVLLISLELAFEVFSADVTRSMVAMKDVSLI